MPFRLDILMPEWNECTTRFFFLYSVFLVTSSPMPYAGNNKKKLCSMFPIDQQNTQRRKKKTHSPRISTPKPSPGTFKLRSFFFLIPYWVKSSFVLFYFLFVPSTLPSIDPPHIENNFSSLYFLLALLVLFLPVFMSFIWCGDPKKKYISVRK